MELSIIIPTLNRLHALKDCVASVHKYTPVEYEIIVYANACTEETERFLDTCPKVRAIADTENKYFTRAVNIAIQQSRGDYVFLLNDDCEVLSDDWFSFYRGLLDQDSKIAMVGPHHHNIDELPYGWIEPYASMYRRDIIDRIGALPYHDETFCLWWSDIYHTYKAMKEGYFTLPLSRQLTGHYVQHKRIGDIGDTVLSFRDILPAGCFEFHGKRTMYQRLGIRDDSELTGYYRGRVWGLEATDAAALAPRPPAA